MQRSIFAVLLASLGAGVPFAAAAQPAGDPCRQGGDRTACFAARPADTLDLFGLPPAEARAAAGASVMRVMILNARSRPVVAIEFLRAPGREPSVSVYVARGSGADLNNEPALTASVPLAEWERLSGAALYFDRALGPMPPDRDADVIMICADGTTEFVEVTDPDALAPGQRLRRRVVNGCPANLTSLYADELAASALRLLPACAGLTPRGRGNEHGVLRDCGMLDGDRMAAAEVHNLLKGLRDNDAPGPMGALFQRDATLDWNGVRAVGSRAAATAWLGYRGGAEGARFFPRRIHGQNGRRVRVTGSMARTTRDDAGREVDWQAPVELVFVFPPSQAWQIERASVGAFTRETRQ